MKKVYDNIEEFKTDLNKEFSFRDICTLNSWIDEKEFVGQMVCCKFHKEKTPSMQVGDHFYRCYGCGKKGDIFNFAQNFNNYSFIEALNDIAASVGCEVQFKKSYNADAIAKKKRLLSYQWEQFKKDYLSECKTNRSLLAEGNRYFPFDVGYSKNENRVVLAFMKNGEPLGFTKRRLSQNENEPKWKHSIAEETLTHLVSQIFNIDSLKKFDYAYITEGPGDVAGMTRAGFQNTICCCGTSNISDKVLDRITAEGIKSLIIAPDGDDAGDKAKIKWIKEIFKYDYYLAINSFVMNLPKDSDPGECSKETLIEIESKKVKFEEYFLDHITDEDIIEMIKDKSFNKNPIIRKSIEKFALNNSLKYDEACFVTKNMVRNSLTENKEEDEYFYKLKSTAGIGDYGLKYDKIEGLTPERALKILKLKYSYKGE